MSAVNNICFRGETEKQYSAANCPNRQYSAASFKGQPADSYEGSKKSHPVLAITGALAFAAGVIALMGYSHKANWTKGMKDGRVKECIETATEKCHEWCHWTKDKGIECFDTVKGWFKSKK